jgi:ornithine decarboxylase
MGNYIAVRDAVAGIGPVNPLHILRPSSLRKAARWFLDRFPGNVLYAVKTNPDPAVLTGLYEAGIRYFDVASIAEIRLTRRLLPDARLCFMHTVKAREAISAAYHEFGVRDFSLDCDAELKKILAVTNRAPDLGLFVRIAIPSTHARINLSEKFGIWGQQAVRLLQDARKAAKRLGVCFHVGSQCMNPEAYAMAMETVRDLLRRAGVEADVIDVGGGFPSVYPGMTPPPLENYIAVIRQAAEDLDMTGKVELWCEPGRALVAEAGSVVVRVDLRKGRKLYLNDGTYGSLFDAGQPGFIFPTRLIRRDGEPTGDLVPFQFYGPTCDSMDSMKGPFMLPSDVREGDYIEVGQTGAYARTFRTDFNGFGADELVFVDEEPQLSMYGERPMVAEPWMLPLPARRPRQAKRVVGQG